MLVPVTILVPQEVANVLQRLEKSSSNKSSTNKNSGKVFQINPVSTQAQHKTEVKEKAAHYKFTPRLLGGRTPSQLFTDVEEQQKSFCQVLPFGLERVRTPNASRQTQNKTIRAQKQKNIVQKNIGQKNIVQKNIGQKNIVQKNIQGIEKTAFARNKQVIVQKIQQPSRIIKAKKQSQKNNVRASNYIPRLFGNRTSSQLFLVSRFTSDRPESKPKQVPRKESFVPRLFGKRTPSQLFFMKRFQEIRSAPEASEIQRNKRNAAAKKNEFVPRLFGKRTSSQLFQISKVLRRRAQLDYAPKSLRLTKAKVRFVPRLFGQITPSQLFLQTETKTSNSKQITKLASSGKKAVSSNIPVYGTTGQHGYLTPSRLLNPYRIKRERYYTLGKGRKTPSELYLAYARQHRNRRSLFGALTASQLLTVANRQANRSQNDRRFDALSSSPTVSQLGLNERRASKSKAKPVAQPSSKLLKHLNQLPMEKSQKIEDALNGLTSSQLFSVSDKPQSKKTVLPQKNANVYLRPQKNAHVYFSKKTNTSHLRDEAEKTKLRPLLYGL